MSFNLLDEPWLPVRFADNQVERISPSQISSPEVMAIAAPRADFTTALVQWLLGLLQSGFAPQDHDEWIERLESPPSKEQLAEAFAPLHSAFELLGDQPAFMQDFDATLQGESRSISTLLIDAPGDSTLKHNKDHFIKRGGAEQICPACAATALFTLQTNAPSGGVGHRTSLRGGGPLTTLVCADPVVDDEYLPPSLWRDLWLNIFPKDEVNYFSGNWDKQALADIFPWLAATRSSEAANKGGCDTYPEDANPLQMYWGMPRRIRLQLDDYQTGECQLCGEQSEQLLSHYVTRNYGVNYIGPWRHPLSPHYSNKEGLPLPEHPQPGGFPYRNWLQFVQDAEQRQAALVVTRFVKRVKIDEAQLQLWVFGYDMDNMKARCWYESYLPLYLIDDPELRKEFEVRVQAMINAAVEIEGILRKSIKEAWFKRPKDSVKKEESVSFLSDDFYQFTETDFYSSLRKLKQLLGDDTAVTELLTAWLKALQGAAQTLFDDHVTRGGIVFSEPKRIAEARRDLLKYIRGKKVLKLLTLA